MIEKYHLQWPDLTNEVSIELACYRRDHPPARGGLGAAGHFKRALQVLWPEKFPDGQRGYIWHPWTDVRIDGWCNVTAKRLNAKPDWQTWWGPSSSGKSTDAGLFALTHWLAAPNRTTVIVCSTTKDMLEQRIWGELLRFYQLYGDQLPGAYHKSKLRISLGDENSKNCIRGVAIQKGTEKEALGNLVGVHNEFNLLIIDEMQAIREAAVSATDNLSTGREFKFLGMGNPESRLDPLGRYSEPVMGWSKVSPETGEWKSSYGITLHFDGLKSPAVAEPKKYFFLLNQEQITNLGDKRGFDSPAFWSQRRGFVPPEGLIQTVITETYLSQFNMTDVAQWKQDFIMCAGLDPSYSSGGDSCVLAPAKIGIGMDGRWIVEFLNPIVINLALSSGKPMAYYLTDQVRKECEKLGIGPRQLAMDTSGIQGIMADVIEKEWGEGLLRVGFGGKASEMPVSASDSRRGHEQYRNRVTELWFNFSEFARGDQIRGLQANAARQFCQRVVKEPNTPVQVETKIEMKKRTGISPDYADASVCVVAYVREIKGVHPGRENLGRGEHDDRYYQETDIDSADDLYLTSEVF